MVGFVACKPTNTLNMDIKETINHTVLSKIVTGSTRKITKHSPAKKYQEDLQELYDMIQLWVNWKQSKHGTSIKRK